MQINDRSDSNTGGVLTGHHSVTVPDNFPNNESKGESGESEHQNVGIEKSIGYAGKCNVEKGPVGPIRHVDASGQVPVKMNPNSSKGSTMPLAKPHEEIPNSIWQLGGLASGGDGIDEMTKSAGPATLHIGKQGFNQNQVRPSATQVPTMSEVMAMRRAGTTMPDKAVETGLPAQGVKGLAQGKAVSHPGNMVRRGSV